MKINSALATALFVFTVFLIPLFPLHPAFSQDAPIANETVQKSFAPRGKIDLKIAGVPSQAIDNGTAELKQTEFTLGAVIPLFQNVSFPEKAVASHSADPVHANPAPTATPPGPSIFGMSLTPAIGGEHIHVLGNSGRDLHLYNARMGVGANYLSPQGEFYFANVAVNVTGEWDSPAALGWLPSGFFMGTMKIDRSLRFLYGAAFSFAYGPGLPLPVLGIAWKISDVSRLIAILPFILKYKSKLSDPLDLNLFFTPAGTQSRFRNDGSFPATSESTLKLKQQAFKLGGGLDFKPGQDWKIGAESGILFGRKYTITDSDNNELDVTRPKASVYALVGLTYRFGGSGKAGAAIDFDDF